MRGNTTANQPYPSPSAQQPSPQSKQVRCSRSRPMSLSQPTFPFLSSPVTDVGIPHAVIFFLRTSSRTRTRPNRILTKLVDSAKSLTPSLSNPWTSGKTSRSSRSIPNTARQDRALNQVPRLAELPPTRRAPASDFAATISLFYSSRIPITYTCCHASSSPLSWTVAPYIERKVQSKSSQATAPSSAVWHRLQNLQLSPRLRGHARARKVTFFPFVPSSYLVDHRSLTFVNARETLPSPLTPATNSGEKSSCTETVGRGYILVVHAP